MSLERLQPLRTPAPDFTALVSETLSALSFVPCSQPGSRDVGEHEHILKQIPFEHQKRIFFLDMAGVFNFQGSCGAYSLSVLSNGLLAYQKKKKVTFFDQHCPLLTLFIMTPTLTAHSASIQPSI